VVADMWDPQCHNLVILFYTQSFYHVAVNTIFNRCFMFFLTNRCFLLVVSHSSKHIIIPYTLSMTY
jgi:hypothetical protein